MLGMSKSNGADTRPSRSGFRPRHWAQAQAENPLARFIPFSSLVSPNDVITRGGDYLRDWRLEGVAYECADDHQIGERRDEAVAPHEAARQRQRAAREHAHQRAAGRHHLVEQAAMARRIVDVDARADHHDGRATGSQRASVRGAVDAERAAGDHHRAGLAEVTREPIGPGHRRAAGRPRPDDGHVDLAIR